MIGGDFAAVVVGETIKRDVSGQWPIALRFGTGGGNAVLKSRDGTEVNVANIVDGETFPCRVQEVVSVTGTVADIVAVYENDA